MKKTFLFLLFSAFSFGQNIEFIHQLQNGDETLPNFVAEKLVPGYKLVQTYAFEPTNYYVYLPGDTTKKDIEEFQKTGEDHYKKITISYKNSGKMNRLASIKGDCDLLFEIWKKEIQPLKEKRENYKKYYYYNDKENIDYYFTGSSPCSINNMNVNRNK